eukprot:1176907-Prorocentrum_minimum.AAC.3
MIDSFPVLAPPIRVGTLVLGKTSCFLVDDSRVGGCAVRRRLRLGSHNLTRTLGGRQILDAIEANDYDNFTKRAYVPKWKKFMTLPASYFNAMRPVQQL